jgi:hypothetical protein
MKKYEFEKTDFGWRAFEYNRAHRAYIYIGHFFTKKDAIRFSKENNQ